MCHRNAKLNLPGRLLLVQRLEAGWTQAQVAEAQGTSRSTVGKWWRRYKAEGLAGLEDRSSRAKTMPHALGQSVISAICNLRRELGAGPHRLAYELKMPRSTIYGVLKRHGLSVLRLLDRTTRMTIRYERGRPGELVHVDVKKLGRVPDGGGKRMVPGFAETGAGPQRRDRRPLGHDYFHVAIDDHSRWLYVECLPNEKAETTARFLERTTLAFASVGVTVERVLSDNAKCYSSRAFTGTADALGIGLRKTRPFRPQTNGKAEAVIKTLQREWAYRRPYASNADRLSALVEFVDYYNHRRPHTAIGNVPPASRL